MIDYYFLIPIAFMLGLAGLAAFLWSLRANQYEDMEGAAARVLLDDDQPLDDGGNAPVTREDEDAGGDRAK